MSKRQAPVLRTDLLGELQTEISLLEAGWHVLRLDRGERAANADMIALKKRHRVALQVKTTNAYNRHSHSDYLHMGYATDFLEKKRSIFNSKESPIMTDIVVGVIYNKEKSRFIVMPVAFAEKICRFHCKYWSGIKTKKMGKRSNSFPIKLCLNANPKAHSKHHEKIKKSLLRFENRWDYLSWSIEKLHDKRLWKLL